MCPHPSLSRSLTSSAPPLFFPNISSRTLTLNWRGEVVTCDFSLVSEYLLSSFWFTFSSPTLTRALCWALCCYL